MTELERPIKELLREPRMPEEALWRRIERARERALPAARLPSFAAALAGVFALGLLVATYVLPQLPQARRVLRDWDQGPLRRADGALLGVLHAEHAGQGGAVVDVALSDGSHIYLAPGAMLVTLGSDAQLFRAELVRGSILFDVESRGSHRWMIEVADTHVEVLGTRFRVEHRPAASGAAAEARVRVAVERGRVSVRGPRVPQGLKLLSGSEQLLLEPQLPAADPPAARSAPPEPAVAPPPPAPSPQARSGAGIGIDDLLRAADVARLSGDHRRAERLLRRALRDHADDAQASLVALTLGRLQLDQLAAPGPAAASLARADRLGLPAAVAEEGAARLVEAYARAGDQMLARQAAARYRQRFPNGPRSASVAQWLAHD